MKNRLYLLTMVFCSIFSAQPMEDKKRKYEPELEEQSIAVKQLKLSATCWDDLPVEVQEMIVLYVASGRKPTEEIKYLKSFMRVNKLIHSLGSNKSVIQHLVATWSQHHPNNTKKICKKAMEAIDASGPINDLDFDQKEENDSIIYYRALTRNCKASNDSQELVEFGAKHGDVILLKELINQGLILSTELLMHVKNRNCIEELCKAICPGFLFVSDAQRACLTALFIHNWQRAQNIVLARKTDVNCCDTGGITPLMAVAAGGNQDLLHVLIDAGAQVNSDAALTRDTALMIAARQGHHACVQVLLNRGAAVHSKNNHGSTALHLAAESGHGAVVNCLLEFGAQVSTQDNSGETALLVATRLGFLDIVKVLIEHGDDVNRKNQQGHTPLMEAAIKGHVDCMKLLLEHEASVDAQDNEGFTALLYAVKHEQLSAVKLLLDHGANVELENRYGINPLIEAAAIGRCSIAALLLERGASLDRVVSLNRSRNWSALVYAAFHGNLATVEVLLNAYHALAKESECRADALFEAVKFGYLEVVKLLFTEKLIEAKNAEGKNVLMVAAEFGHRRIVEFLLEHIHPHEKDTQGRTARDFALKNGHMHVAAILP